MEMLSALLNRGYIHIYMLYSKKKKDKTWIYIYANRQQKE